MTNSTSPRRRGLALIGAASAVAALALPTTAGAVQIDPAVYETGVPAGVIEHGVVTLDITGIPQPRHETTEYWATATGWHAVDRDASGKTIGESMSTATDSAVVDYVNNYAIHIPYPNTPPYAGWTPAYSKKVVDRGLLQPAGQQTVAGIAGTVYTVPDSKKTSDPSAGPDKWTTTDTAAQTTIVLENGTYAPLLTEHTKAGGTYGPFDQREALQSRERTPLTTASASAARVSKSSLAKLVTTWKHRVKAAKRRARH